jgi:hypothetical protein
MPTLRQILGFEITSRKTDSAFSVLGGVGLIALGAAVKSWSMALTGFVLVLAPVVPDWRRKT